MLKRVLLLIILITGIAQVLTYKAYLRWRNELVASVAAHSHLRLELEYSLFSGIVMHEQWALYSQNNDAKPMVFISHRALLTPLRFAGRWQLKAENTLASAYREAFELPPIKHQGRWQAWLWQSTFEQTLNIDAFAFRPFINGSELDIASQAAQLQLRFHRPTQALSYQFLWQGLSLKNWLYHSHFRELEFAQTLQKRDAYWQPQHEHFRLGEFAFAFNAAPQQGQLALHQLALTQRYIENDEHLSLVLELLLEKLNYHNAQGQSTLETLTLSTELEGLSPRIFSELQKLEENPNSSLLALLLAQKLVLHIKTFDFRLANTLGIEAKGDITLKGQLRLAPVNTQTLQQYIELLRYLEVSLEISTSKDLLKTPSLAAQIQTLRELGYIEQREGRDRTHFEFSDSAISLNGQLVY